MGQENHDQSYFTLGARTRKTQVNFDGEGASFVTWFDDLLLKLMLRIGLHLGFGTVLIFAPGAEQDSDAPVRAVHFATSEHWLSRSIRDYRENEK